MSRVLDLPWGYKAKNTFYDRTKKVTIYKGDTLPHDLVHFGTEDFSYQRWVEDDMNGRVIPPVKPATIFKPREHQTEAAKAIYRAYHRNWRGILLADSTGLGKTLSALTGISAVAKKAGFRPDNKANLLIVCPKAVIPQWRQTLRSYPVSTSLTRPLVINYHQLNKLLTAPKNARMKSAKKRRTKNRIVAGQGTPTVAWDYVVFDEAHTLKNYNKSEASLSAASIALLNKRYTPGKSPFVIFSTATPGATPLNMAIMAGIIAPLISSKPEAKLVTPDTWGQFLFDEGFAVKQGKVDWTWVTTPWYGKNSEDPKEREKYEKAQRKTKLLQRKDSKRIGKALTKEGAPFIMRSPVDLANWPKQQYIATPVSLSKDQWPIYEEAWSRFRRWLKLSPARTDSKARLVETLRYRQKASLLKVDQVVGLIEEWVAAGNQVFVSCLFIETVERYAELLTKKGISSVEISGRNSDEREDLRLQFQKGKAQVALCTVVAGVSFHQEEDLPDGSKATSNPRITVIHDIRQNNLDTSQATGRAHRDGQNSLTYFPYIEDTVEEAVIGSFTNKQTNMSTMMGSADEDAEELEAIFRAAADREQS